MKREDERGMRGACVAPLNSRMALYTLIQTKNDGILSVNRIFVSAQKIKRQISTKEYQL
jgi:hypothetical protein